MGTPFKEISNADLQLSDIPAADAPFEAVEEFGYTFDGYKQFGSACAAIANEPRHGTLSELRACLYFEQRRGRFTISFDGETDNKKEMSYQRSLVEKIRAKVSANERT